MKQYIQSLWQPVNNARLVAFRVLFGLVMSYECFGSLLNGWVKDKYVDTQYNFTFIGFDWLNVLHGSHMYAYYFIMGLLALGIAAGFLYRISSIFFAILWTLIYLSDKSHYNNHFYLMLLLSWLMTCMPANKRFSADVKCKIVQPIDYCFRWQTHLFIFQVVVVYFFAATAKMNSDWLHAIPVTTWLYQRTGLPLIGHYLRNPLMPWFVAYGGLFFDLFIIPALLYRRTRLFAFILSVFFHSFNSYVFSIGTFPFLALSLNVFFFSDQLLEKIVGKKVWENKNEDENTGRQPYGSSGWVNGLLGIYVFMQIFLPLRHWLIPGDVNWTEEGHRHSWRMMVRSKTGTSMFKIVDKKNDSIWYLPPAVFFDSSHLIEIAVLPDFTWQAAKHIEELYKKNNQSVAIYSINQVSLNYRHTGLFIDTTIDLTHTKWNYFGHNGWILTEPKVQSLKVQ